ncbi:MAG TPA: phosphoglycerate kinase [bacterium]|nr:phosphoglycerate kinase [bacterium]
MAVKYIDELELEGKHIFLRADLNVPLAEGKITDDTRIRAVLPTVRKVLRDGGRLVVASHLGRPKGKYDEKLSLMPVAERMAELLDRDVIMAPDVVSDGVKVVAQQLKDGEVMMLENLRFIPGETANDPEFAAKLAELATVYVNDAFGSSHRAHASVEALPRLVEEKAAGYLMRKELRYLKEALADPERPFWAILGGAKVSDKIGVVNTLLDKVDGLIIGGGMAYTFLAAKGFEVGKSLVDGGRITYARETLARAEKKGAKILLPVDHVVAATIAADAAVKIVTNQDFPTDMMGLDIGPETIRLYTDALVGAKTIVWNGPMGVFEHAPFAAGTIGIAKAVAESGSISIVGGGDSVSAVKKAGMADKISHISTGGGASLELLEGKELPGVTALES